MKRILCLALVLLMLLPMAIACKKDEEPTGTGNSDVAGNNQEEASTDLLATIPSANYGGKDFIISMQRGSEVIAEELTGETGNDTIYQWLQKINSIYGVNVKGQIPTGDFWQAQSNEASSGNVKTALYGHNAYDIYRAVNAGLYKNWNSMGEMIDLSAERWDQIVNGGLTWNGVLYGLTGDLGYSKLQGAMATYCNVELLDEIGYTTDDLYKMVEDKEWTFDFFQSIVKDYYIDTDYDGKKSAGDTYGFVSTSGNAHDIWLEQFGIAITKVNEVTDKIEPTLSTLENVNVIDMVWSFLHENQGVYSAQGWAASYTVIGPEDAFFSDRRAVMITTRLSYAKQFSEDLGTDAFGILPAPLLNEDQDDYYTKLFDGYTIWGVSKNILDSDVDFIAHITDALCAESSQTVYPKFYDILLKQRYSKDPATAKMVDIVMKNVNIDATFMFSSLLSNYPRIARNLLSVNTAPDLKGAYDGIAGALVTGLETLYSLHTPE